MSHKIYQKFKKITTYVVIFALAVASLPVSPVLATAKCAIEKDDLEFYAKNNILYFCPKLETSGAGCFDVGSVSVTGSTVAEKIWNALTSAGFSEEQAAGVMGNMESESNFNPAQHEIGDSGIGLQPGFDIATRTDTSYGLGLIQWSFGRRTGLVSFINSKNPDLVGILRDYQKYSPTYVSGDQFLSLAGESATDALISYEIEYLASELHSNTDYAGIFDQNDVGSAAEYFLRYIERPGDIEGQVGQRKSQAQKWYERYHGTSGSSSGNTTTNNTTEGNITEGNTTTGNTTSSSDSTCDPSGSGGSLSSGEVSGLQELVLKYAWREVRSGEKNPTDAYHDAYDSHSASGGYVGGGYTDCGAFVTILLQDSGIDPNYGGGGNTITQENYVRSHGWVLLNSSENSPIDTNILQPGDVAFSEGPVGDSGHTFIYVGNIPGFSSTIASASLDGHVPMAGPDDLSTSYNNSYPVRWYRKGN